VPLAVSRILWRAAPVQVAPSDLTAQWAKYSHLKEITRREGLHQQFLIACLEKLRRGERAVIVSWQERPVALLWLAREAAAAAAAAGFTEPLDAGAALLTDSYLALDLRGSPRRDTLPSTLLTFLAAEGIVALFGIQDTRHAPPALAQCGQRLVPIARRLEIQVLGLKARLAHRFAVED
jgi:hypothetical protein